ncbi:MAG: hemolysin family protein [Spirochaetales bacterium]|nr:hemolysin family protein [Spirochaetales bacterium]
MKVPGFLKRLFNTPAGAEKDLSAENTETEEQDMILGIKELANTTVKEVMVPRIDVEFISNEASSQELFETIIKSGHSRFPVYQDTIDNVVGMLYIKDVLTELVSGRQLNIEKIARSAYFVPESKRLDSLLRELKRRKVHIAVAVDEYGGVSGVVCFENIIEEIIGDIQDEFDNERDNIVKVGEGVYLCDARVNISDLNANLNLSIPDKDFDTLGGFVFELFGKIPVRYEKIEYENIQFVIQDMEGHKINSIKLMLPPKQET